MDSDTLNLITIPLFSGAIGYITNWSGVIMLFYPVHFKGVRIPGLLPLTAVLPRKVRQIPGVSHGGIGWQGIIPSRAAKMGSIAVDKGIAKLGSPSEFYAQLEPDRIAEHILVSARGDIRELVERIMEREHPRLWKDLPPQLREAVHARVQQQLPDIVREVTDGIGDQHRPPDRHQADGDPAPRGEPRAGEQDLPRGRPQGAQVHRQLRLLLRAAARHPGRLHHAGVPPLVGAADPRRRSSGT